MKLKHLFLALLLPVAVLAFQSCNKCTVDTTIKICDDGGGNKTQWLSVTYIDTVGVDRNYITDIYNLANVRVYLSKTGKTGNYTLLQEDFSDGMFGPWYFSCAELTPNIQIGAVYDYAFKIDKDTYGTDVWELRFALQTDECHTFWTLLRLKLNGQEVENAKGKEVMEMVINE